MNDPSGGGFSLYGSPWWVALIGLVIVFPVVGLIRLWWRARLEWMFRRGLRRRKRRDPDELN